VRRKFEWKFVWLGYEEDEGGRAEVRVRAARVNCGGLLWLCDVARILILRQASMQPK